ncbi:ATP-dependent RNA helicase, putative [Leishmania tarentolae]|uniref:ATP-dependent RNA helicase n=1 Tax=Leishmania tarentolae TaxID=5689 RepID=A0A640KVI8_LEITA|nr:ATP-dependent RNA helicase, putative [Leishmania tarentolae]
MGIKGRRKKLRQREELARQQQAQGYSGEDDGEVEGVVDGLSSGVVLMGDGPFRPPVDAMGQLKMKKSDLFRMQDMEVLEQMQEEHQCRRKQSQFGALVAGGGSAGRKRRRGAAEDSVEDVAEEVEKSYLGHQYAHEDLFGDLKGATSGYQSTTLSSATTDAPVHSGSTQARKKSASSKAEDPANQEGETVDLIERRRNAAHGALFCHPLIGLDPVVVDALQSNGFRRMTRIQERSIPYALEGYDLLGQARTGSGKTLAFCVPLLHLAKNAVIKYPHATVGLLLAPTKELCVQTHSVLSTLCKHIAAVPVAAGGAQFHVQLITGGTKVSEERRRLTSGMASIVVGTPGRIHDHVLHCKGWDLSRLRLLVLDEADRMLADGFQRDLDAVIIRIPKGRQTFLFSATNSKSVRELARLSLSRLPLFISIAGDAPSVVNMDGTETAEASASMAPYRVYNDPNEDGDDAEDGVHRRKDEGGDVLCSEDAAGEADSIPSTLRQFGYIVPSNDRLRALYTFVKQVARRAKAMIFCSTVASAIFHCQMMGSIGFHDDVMMLHGHMKHRQRVQTFELFTEWKTGVLFCTDVAARGLDIPHVSWILQYDPPLDPTEYIHRIGRTARAGTVGNSLLFLTPEEAPFVRYLANYGIHMEKYPMPEKLPRIQEKLEHVLQLDEVVAKSAVTAFRAHVGAYQSHILKETFDVHRLNLEALSKAFALTAVPHVTLPRNTEEEKRKEYIKGRLKSLNRRRLDALRHYETNKTRPQWENGRFVGVLRPSMN